MVDAGNPQATPTTNDTGLPWLMSAHRCVIDKGDLGSPNPMSAELYA